MWGSQGWPLFGGDVLGDTAEVENPRATFSFELHMKVKVLVTYSCPTLCNTMDSSLPSSSVHGILQAKIMEWVAIPFSRGSS